MSTRMIPPDKLYFTIGEVAEIFGVNTSLIRYWEQEFEELRPHKNRKGDRRYVKKDIDSLEKIYHLLKEKGFTIEGAKKEMTKPETNPSETEIIKKLLEMKKILIKIKDNL